MEKSQNIAIIGGGVSSVSILSHMVHNAGFNDEITIDIYDTERMMGRGPAYQEDSRHLLINVPTEEMSLGNGHPSYREWLESNSHEPVTYTSRYLFGEYMRELMTSVAKVHDNIHLHHTLADDIQYDSENGRFTLHSGDEVKIYDHLFLTIGQLNYLDPYQLKASEGYIYDPYPLDEGLSAVDDDRIGIVGSGLSAIDCIRYLLIERGVPEVHAFSRSGDMPSVRGTPTDVELSHFTYEELESLKVNDEISLESIKEIFKKELAHQGVDEALLDRRTGNTLADLRFDVSHLDEIGRLQYVIISVNPIFSDVYQYLSRSDKVEFLDKYHPLIEENHSPMPLEVAEDLIKWAEAGQLHIVDGTRSIEKEDEFIVSTEEEEQYFIRTLINATGPEKDVRQDDTGIIGALLNHQIIAPSEFGGILVDQKRHVISPKTGTIENMFVLGSLTTGADYLSNSVQLLNRNAQKIVDQFYNQLK
ncbi:FAD/NAD(P)-binding protein [Salinicoccus roseus]|uniref:FAD/NAD(P)-binding protein n=1 Tax=Salinicoccus roseus TaxID=45670 RepID=UPI0023003D62|nr:FAD/NAD(P)-binding protein [Salinicoccus roseus]